MKTHHIRIRIMPMNNSFICAVLFSLSLSFPLQTYAQDSFGSEEIAEKQKKNKNSDNSLPVLIYDKNGQAYEFGQRYYLKHGLASFHFYITSLATPNYQLTVYDGETFGDAETCPSKEEKEQVFIETASISRKHTICDVNGDGFKDVKFEAEEMNCATGEHKKIKRIFYAAENGFELENKEEK